MTTSSRGSVFRRCACRDADGRQLGAQCPKLASSTRHGVWAYRAPKPGGGRRAEIRRFGFTTKAAALAALDEVLDARKEGVSGGEAYTVESYLRQWLGMRSAAGDLKPTTRALYLRYIDNDIVPAIGAVRLTELHHDHIRSMVDGLTTAGRGSVTIRRIMATLSSALTEAVTQRTIRYNPATAVRLAKPRRVEHGAAWGVAEAVAFLAYVADVRDRDAELFEFLIGTGMRKGEALALRWSDVDLDGRTAHVRRTLVIVPGAGMGFGDPKTEGSAAGVGLSVRVIDALKRQRTRQNAERSEWGAAYEDGDLVFPRENGAPQRPESMLRRFKALTKAAGLPVIRVHDLRHLAASMMLAAGVPLTIVSKTLRHSTTRITSDVYGHLTKDVSRKAVDAMAEVLNASGAEAEAMKRARVALDASHT